MRGALFVVAMVTGVFLAVIPANAQTQLLDHKACGTFGGCTTTPNTDVSGLLYGCMSSFTDTTAITITTAGVVVRNAADISTGSGTHAGWFYVVAPATGSQSVQISSASYSSLSVTTWKNTGAIHGTTTSSANGTSTVQPGSQTPTANDLAISCGALYPGTPSVASPFFITGILSGSDQADVATGFYQAPNTTALNPTWTMTGTGNGSAASLALFAGFAGGGGGSNVLSMHSGTTALAADGKTLTAPIDNCVVSLSPASSVTGANVYYGGIEVYVAPANFTTSGCNLIATLATGQQAGDTMTITLNTALISNLHDTLNNTPVGQTAFAVTNNSALAGVTANYNATNVYPLGNWSVTSGVANANSYPSNSIEFACANSTDAQVLGPVSGITVQSNGGAFTTITPTASGYSWQPIATGLSLTTNTFKVIATSVTSANSVRCSSSSTASLSAIAAYSGATFTAPQASGYTTSVVNYGSPTNTNATLAGLTWASLNGGFKFTKSPTKITAYTAGTGGTIQLYQDGTLIATANIPSDGKYDGVSLATGLSGLHTYQGAWQGPTANGNVFTGLITDAVLNGSPPATPINVMGCGDSIAVGFGLGSGSFSGIDWWGSTFPLGSIGDQYSGAGGTQVYMGPAPGPLSTYCALQILPTPVKAFEVTGGANDCLQGVSQANFGGAYATLLTSVAGAVGMLAAGGKIFARGVLATTNTGNSCNTNVTTYNATIATRVATYNGGSPTYPAIYISTANWWNPANATLTADGLHPNAAGYAVIANLETPIMAGLIGPSYTLTCPATGNVGVAMTCTLALKGNANWTTLSAGVSPAETLNLSIGGITGTFNKSNPWNPTAGGNSDTFTFTPTSAGAGTISSAATSAGWVDPGGASITVTSAFAANPSVITVP